MYIYNMPITKAVIATVHFGPDRFGSLKEVLKDVQTKDHTLKRQSLVVVVIP